MSEKLAEKALLMVLDAGLDAFARGVSREAILDAAAQMQAAGKSHDEINAGIRALVGEKVDALDRVQPPA